MSRREELQLRLQESKVSWILIALALLLAGAALISWLLRDNPVVAGILGLSSFFFLINFFRIKITIDRECICIDKGLGLFTTIVALSDIRALKIVPNSFLSGRFYNPRGEDVLVLELFSGRRMIVPVSDPKGAQHLLSLKGR